MKFRLLLAATVLGLTGPAWARPQVAFTFDDLPVHGPTPSNETPLSIANRTIAALKAAHVPATGFVNGRWSEAMPSSMAALTAWRAAGFPIGNHSWSHANLSDAPAGNVAPEITRNEAVLQQYAPSSDWHWFRYPFLAEGADPARRLQIRQLLADRG